MNWKDGMRQSFEHMRENDDEVYGMRFVHVIARLKEAQEVEDTFLDDLDTMAIEILDGAVSYTSPKMAMIDLIERLEVTTRDKVSTLSSKIAGFEYRRDFRTP